MAIQKLPRLDVEWSRPLNIPTGSAEASKKTLRYCYYQPSLLSKILCVQYSTSII